MPDALLSGADGLEAELERAGMRPLSFFADRGQRFGLALAARS